jgi:DtxR family manganese transport transcriptional regulator
MKTNRFERIRADHSRETAEDYVELVESLIAERGEARVVALAAGFGVSQVTVSKTLQRLQREHRVAAGVLEQRLQREGYVSFEKYRSIFLTPKGQELASYARNRHDIVYRFLRKLGVVADVAEADAEGIEHHVSSETLAAMEQFLNSNRNE